MSGDNCDCLVCAVRRWAEEHHPAGSNHDEAIADIGSQLGGVIGVLSVKNDTAMKAFLIGYAEARASVAARAEPEEKSERGPMQ